MGYKIDEVEDFIKRHFGFEDKCNWQNGNCYYFARILKDRFPDGEIVYCIIEGHFIFQYKNKYYDSRGLLEVSPKEILVY